MGNAVHKGEMRNAFRVVLGKSEAKKPLGRPRYRWVNTKMNLEETEWEGFDCVLLVQDKNQRRSLINTVEHHRVQINSRNVSIKLMACQLLKND